MLGYAALFVLCVTTAHAQVIFIGSCPNVPVIKDFDVTKYLGKWYEQARFFAIFELNAKCVTANYSAKADGAVRVLNREVDDKTNAVRTIEGEATLADNSGEGRLKVRFPGKAPFPAPYNVVSTDYSRFAVVWSCVDVLHLANAEFAWVLTRDKNPSDDVMNDVHDVLQQTHIDTSKFSKTIQNCSDN